MSRTFEIDKEPYDIGEYVYTKDEFTFEPGVTVLVGCNGIGKSTLIRTLKEQLKIECISMFSFDNFADGGAMAKSKAMLYGNIQLAGSLMCSSEGEQIVANLCELAAEIGRFIRENADESEYWLFFDAIDSGMSVDNVDEVKEYLFDRIIADNPNADVYIIVSANGYEMCRGQKCFDTRNGEYIEFKTYEQYRRFVLKSRKQKDKRKNKPRTPRRKEGAKNDRL